MSRSRFAASAMPWVCAGLLAFTTGCQTTYYKTMEAFGVHKREILVDRVEEARDDQEEAKEQFKTALEAFSEVVQWEGGDLQKMYDKLNDEYERSKSKADDVHERIDAVEDVGDALFAEWEKELDQYESAELRRSSEKLMKSTRRNYDGMVMAMRKAESKMEPVLTRLHDQVLFLKHNLNARAIASLETTVVSFESDVAALIQELERSIAEANEFIDSVNATEG